VKSFLLSQELKEENLFPCYFFFGEEAFLAHQFIQQLRAVLVPPDAPDFSLERFDLADSSWIDIIDLARTMPFIFSPWRIIVVEIPERKSDRESEKEERKRLSSKEEKILRDYLASPSRKTILVIIFSGKTKRNHSLCRFFLSFQPSVVCVQELKPLRERELYSWIEQKLSLLGKNMTPEAKKRLVEVIGNDLAMLDKELDKLSAYSAEKNIIELDDVNQASGWIKSFEQWELDNSLEKADFRQCLIVLDNLFKEGIKPEFILGRMANFFRDILVAKNRERENPKEKKEIFREFKPQISETTGPFYRDKFREFFAYLDSLDPSDLNHILEELERVDLKVKTSDVSPQTLLESFLFDYCSLLKNKRITWKGRD
jgi:DNA polymerase III delta subunit